ncbi:MAG: hypothetical protein ABH800_02090 [Candidatus Nealsonbacteria bacterium]
MDIIDKVITFLVSPEIQEKIFPIKVAFLAISAIFIVVTIVLVFKTKWFQWYAGEVFTEFFSFRPFGKKKITKTWIKITKRLEAGSESEYKLAVIEADDMMENSLKKMGYAGQTVEEKLQNLTSVILPNIEEVKEAHRIRNNIVHDPDYRLSLEEAKKTLDAYGKAFDSFQILA